MALSLQNFSTLVSNMAAAVQASASALIDLTAGSVTRAILEANASVALWLQWLILQVLSITRLATSTGTDVDSFVADYGLTRLPGVPASGGVTFARFSTTVTAFIPVGAKVKTSDGTRIFAVIADSTNAAWNGSTGFNLPAETASVTLTVQDVTTNAAGVLSVGAAGNVQAGTIALLASSISGVDTVNNALPFANGADEQSDASLQTSFSNYIQTRSQATLAAVNYAISSVQQGLVWNITENASTTGAYQPGNFVVVVDDGTGSPPAALIQAVSSQIALYRPIGSTWSVQAPSIVNVAVQFSFATNPITNHDKLLVTVQNAILNYVNALADGATLPYSRIANVVYAVDPTIINVYSVLLNSDTADVIPAANQVIKLSSANLAVS